MNWWFCILLTYKFIEHCGILSFVVYYLLTAPLPKCMDLWQAFDFVDFHITLVAVLILLSDLQFVCFLITAVVLLFRYTLYVYLSTCHSLSWSFVTIGFVYVDTQSKPSLLWVWLWGAFLSLTLINIERYPKVVHSVWTNKKTTWMIYSEIGFRVDQTGFLYQISLVFESSSTVINGAYLGYVMWKNPTTGMPYVIFYFLISYYVIALVIFIFFCGKKIFLAIFAKHA